jgi:hypothetical protein
MTVIPAVVALVRRGRKTKFQKMMGNSVEQKLCKMFNSH